MTRIYCGAGSTPPPKKGVGHLSVYDGNRSSKTSPPRQIFLYPDLPREELFALYERYGAVDSRSNTVAVDTPEASGLYEIEAFYKMDGDMLVPATKFVLERDVGLLRQGGIEELRFGGSGFKILLPKDPNSTGFVPPNCAFHTFTEFSVTKDRASIPIAVFPITQSDGWRIGALFLFAPIDKRFSEEFIEKMWLFVYELGKKIFT